MTAATENTAAEITLNEMSADVVAAGLMLGFLKDYLAFHLHDATYESSSQDEKPRLSEQFLLVDLKGHSGCEVDPLFKCALTGIASSALSRTANLVVKGHQTDRMTLDPGRRVGYTADVRVEGRAPLGSDLSAMRIAEPEGDGLRRSLLFFVSGFAPKAKNPGGRRVAPGGKAPHSTAHRCFRRTTSSRHDDGLCPRTYSGLFAHEIVGACRLEIKRRGGPIKTWGSGPMAS